MSVVPEPALLARGPWAPEDVVARWRDEPLRARRPRRPPRPTPPSTALRDRGSPSHDGLAAPARRTTRERRRTARARAAAAALGAAPGRGRRRRARSPRCASSATRDGPLARRPARGVAVVSGPGRWALGAGGAVDVGESPADTLVRELSEEWSVAPERAAAARRSCACPTGWSCSSARPGWPPGAEVDARRRARRARLVAGRPRRLAGRGRRAAAPHGATLLGRCSDVVSDDAQVRVVRPLGDLPRRCSSSGSCPGCTARSSSSAWPTGSAGSSCASPASSPCGARVIPLRLAVAVVVLGGVGPFVGIVEFVREERRRRSRGTRRCSGALESSSLNGGQHDGPGHPARRWASR